jgi:ParB family chromosome partitioning protein
MAKKTTPLSNNKPRRSYVSNFEELKAEVLADSSAQEPVQSLQQVAITALQRGRYQPRDPVDDAALQELADSIEVLGILEPLVVRPLAQAEGFEVLAGHRRWYAARKAGLQQVPVIVRQADDRTAAAITLVENLQRQDLNPMEEARALQMLMDEFELSQTEIGELVSKSKSVISRALGLLSLTAQIQTCIESGQLDAGHGRVLLNLKPDQQNELAEKAIKHGWSVRELEKRKALLNVKRLARSKTADNRDTGQLESRLGDWLAARVAVKPDQHGQGGKIVISYRDSATRQNILKRMGLSDIEPE